MANAKSVSVPSNAAVTAAKIALGAVGIFTVLLVILHIIEPEFHPMWRFLSEYANGPFGWMMKLSFVVLAVSCVAVAAAARQQVTTKPGKVGLALLVLTALGMVLAAMNNQDPITSKATTDEGNMHALATMIGIPGFSLGSLLVGLSLARHNSGWAPGRTKLLLLSNAAWVSFIGMMVYMAIVMPSAGGFGPTVWVGLINRIFMIAMCLWLAFVAYRVVILSKDRG